MSGYLDSWALRLGAMFRASRTLTWVAPRGAPCLRADQGQDVQRWGNGPHKIHLRLHDLTIFICRHWPASNALPGWVCSLKSTTGAICALYQARLILLMMSAVGGFSMQIPKYLTRHFLHKSLGGIERQCKWCHNCFLLFLLSQMRPDSHSFISSTSRGKQIMLLASSTQIKTLSQINNKWIKPKASSRIASLVMSFPVG